MGIKHAFTNPQSDGGDATITRPSDWNADHVGANLVLLSDTSLGSPASTITATGLSGAYRDLIVVLHLRGTDAGAGLGAKIQVGNGSIDTGSNYAYYQNFTGWTSGNNNSTGATSAIIGAMPNSGATSGYFGAQQVVIMDYAASSRSRNWIGQSFSQDGSGILYCDFAGAWKNVSGAIDEVRVTASAGNFDTGSAMTIYGRG